MDQTEETLRIELMEAILDYFEGQRSFRSVLDFGMSAKMRGAAPKNPNVAQAISQLHTLSNIVSEGQTVSQEHIRETFTQMLEKLMQGY